MGKRRKKGSLTPWFEEILRLNAAFNDTGLQLLERLATAVEANDTGQIPGLVDQLVQIDPGDYWGIEPLFGIRLVDEVSNNFFDDLQARLIFVGDYASYRRIFDWWQPKRHSRQTEVTWHKWLWWKLPDVAVSGVFVLKRQNPVDSRFVTLVRTLDAFFRDYQRDAMKRSARKSLKEEIFKILIDGVHLAFQLRIDEIANDIGNYKANERLVIKLRKQLASVLAMLNRYEDGQRLASTSVLETAKYKPAGKHQVYFDYFSEFSARKANALLYFYYLDDENSLEDARKARVKEGLEMRERQIEFLEFFYGIKSLAPYNELAELQDAVVKALKALPKQQTLNSNEFWIALLPPVFETLFLSSLKRWEELAKALQSVERKTAEDHAKDRSADAPGIRAVAWTNCILLLRWYFDMFVEHAKYDIRDSGKSYLSTLYPATTTGRLLHDCGVYAVRIAYIIGVSTYEIAKRTRRHPGTLTVKGSFVLLPYHVGLVLETSEGAACITNNGEFDLFSSKQINDLQKRWTSTNDEGGKREKTDKVPLDEDRFWGDLTASKFIDTVDMSFRVAKIPRLTAPKTTVKREVWRTYIRRVVRTNRQLFSRKALSPAEGEFDIANAYLQLLRLKKEWYNRSFVPFWNNEAIRAWLKFGPKFEPLLDKVADLKEKIDKETDALAVPAGKLTEVEKNRRNRAITRMELEVAKLWGEFDRHRLDYLETLMVGGGEVKRVTNPAEKTRLDYLSNEGLEGVRKGEKELDELRAKVEQYLDANPGAINRIAARSRHKKVNEVSGRHGEVFAHIKEVWDVEQGFSLRPPPFSSRTAQLELIPE